MHLAELDQLLLWIEANIAAADVVATFERLESQLDSNMKPNNETVSLEPAFQALRSTLAAVPIYQLNASQQHFLGCLGLGEHIGGLAGERMAALRVQTNIDPATVLQRIRAARESVMKGVAQARNIRAAVGDCWPEQPAAAEGVVARFTFAGRSSISDVEGLKQWSEKLYLIGYGFSMAHGETAQDVRIVRAGTGSVIFDIAGNLEVIKTIADTLLGIAQLGASLAALRLTKKQLEGQGPDFDDVAALIEQKIDERLQSGVEQIAETAIDSTGATGDAANALRVAVRETNSLIASDGEIDIYLPAPGPEKGAEADEGDSPVAELRSVVEKYREQLEHWDQDTRLLANPDTKDDAEEA